MMMGRHFKTGLILVFCVIVIAIALFLRDAPPGQASPRELPPTIKQVDHVVVQAPEPEKIHTLFVQELGLPVAWQMTSYGDFSSGGVSFGNVNMELLNSSLEMRHKGLIPEGNGYIGIAFQPHESLVTLIPVLDAYQIPHEPVVPYTIIQNGTPRPLWYTLVLSDMMPSMMIFYCEYTFNQTGFRNQMEHSLATVHGGPLGIVRMKQITVEYKDQSMLETWQRLLPQAKGGDPELRDGGNGVTITLKHADRNAISSITLQVKSLEQAKTNLEEKGLLGPVSEGQISFNPSALSGLDVHLTE